MIVSTMWSGIRGKMSLFGPGLGGIASIDINAIALGGDEAGGQRFRPVLGDTLIDAGLLKHALVYTVQRLSGNVAVHHGSARTDTRIGLILAGHEKHEHQQQ
jgi:hypothetical protein